jgi:hypothetical protein
MREGRETVKRGRRQGEKGERTLGVELGEDEGMSGGNRGREGVPTGRSANAS